MNKKNLIDLLVKSYSLPKNQADALKILVQKDASAEEILKKTTISSGRIYQLLKDMERVGLIEKIPGKPAIYSTKNFPQKIRNFLDYSFSDHVSRQNTISDALTDLEEKTQVRTIYGSREKYDAEIIKMFIEAKWVKIIHKHISHPWFLYPKDEKKFLKIREKINQTRIIGSSPNKHDLLLKKQAYANLYRHKKVEHIMLKQTYEDFFDLVEDVLGKTEKDKLTSEASKKLKKQRNVNIYVMGKLFTPFSTYVTDKQVLIPLFFSNKKHRVLIMRGKEIIKTYKDYFEEYKSGAKVF